MSEMTEEERAKLKEELRAEVQEEEELQQRLARLEERIFEHETQLSDHEGRIDKQGVLLEVVMEDVLEADEEDDEEPPTQEPTTEPLNGDGSANKTEDGDTSHTTIDVPDNVDKKEKRRGPGLVW
jgi:chromosome segregation ATPase